MGRKRSNKRKQQSSCQDRERLFSRHIDKCMISLHLLFLLEHQHVCRCFRRERPAIVAYVDIYVHAKTNVICLIWVTYATVLLKELCWLSEWNLNTKKEPLPTSTRSIFISSPEPKAHG